MQEPSRTSTAPSRLAVVVVLVAAMLGVGGCIKPLFPEDKPRTQFDSYNKMRSRYIPTEELDAFGTPRPALRARLGRQE
ncbi:MAG: hypothetical protein SGJ09_08920 [Phycisphaerae bacterium]|nr:hypothetical protein [Phycisphaerae bacterium]